MTTFRIVLFAAALLPVGLALHGEQEIDARITMTDGSSRMVRIDGVGCSLSICSRTAIEAKDKDHSVMKTSFDAIAVIRDTTANEASFVMKDGSQRRVSLLKDFRVLYLATPLGGEERLDLANVKSVDFTAVSK